MNNSKINLEKKADSLVVSYVLLIVIGIALGTLVYSFLSGWIPPFSKPVCSSEINLVLEDSICNLTTGKLLVQISNKGLFNVSTLYVRFGKEGNEIREQVNENNPFLFKSLPPGESISASYNISSILTKSPASTSYIIEIQPAILVKQKIVLCEESVITQPVTCTGILPL
ncbi:MAG: hypothetical protein Q7S74_02360 [Nanoarchaeota archaeon]|nr:hypothetical protein [Nanoarchaeota archaeon]